MLSELCLLEPHSALPRCMVHAFLFRSCGNIDCGAPPTYADMAICTFLTSAPARRDFKLKNVASINASGHKFGLVYPGVGWCIFRSKAFLPESLVFHDNYLGTDQISFTLNFSKGASQIRPARTLHASLTRAQMCYSANSDALCLRSTVTALRLCVK